MTETISERARQKLQPKEMKEADRPISEQWRTVAAQWVELDAAARLLEETKTSVLAEKINHFRMEHGGNVAHNAAESAVKASADWHKFLHEMVGARTKANRARVQKDYLAMLFDEWRSLNANARQERKM